jgi:hypothetical protein
MQEEFFAAGEDEIEGAAENGPGGKFETVEAKLDSVSICTLGEIVGAGTYDALLDRAFDGYRGGGSDYSGLLLVPDEVRDGLATVASLETVAERWHANDEMREWTPAEVREVLGDLASLAQRARAPERHLWCWWSL